ncbi:ATP-binding protein [[Kitasatospora] papulosa]|uniref:ATP-binding protein n=1 Tax=Streptomyces TaxID=1883 RepID=UPI0018FE0404|nr:ATP-binding protein [Streptomyces sp. NRRL S-325]
MPAPHSRPIVGVQMFNQRFSATRRGARLARLLASLQLVEWGHPHGTDDHDRATIVVAELTANAALHGCVPGRDFALLLTYETHRSVVRIEVSDTHPAEPTLVTPAPDLEHGRGLVIVGALATRWGVSGRIGPGKTVWAECVLSTEPSPGLSCL